MSPRPHVVCHMIVSLDGRIHPSRWTRSPDGGRRDWSALYEKVHDALAGDGWIVGRVTMAEMSKAGAHPPDGPVDVRRPHHFAVRQAACYAIAIDRSGKLHFGKPDVGGDPVVVLLGRDVSLLAAGLVDEISLLVAPAIDGGDGVTGAFDAAASLAGTVRLSLIAAETLGHGVVHLRYAVTSEPTGMQATAVGDIAR